MDAKIETERKLQDCDNALAMIDQLLDAGRGNSEMLTNASVWIKSAAGFLRTYIASNDPVYRHYAEDYINVARILIKYAMRTGA